MTDTDFEKEGTPQKPTSEAVFIFNIFFYVASLAWIAYSTYELVKLVDYGLRFGDGFWFFYYTLQSTVVGFVTFKVLIDLKFKESHFFKKNNLVLLFVAFAITAPLASLPLFLLDVPTRSSEWGLVIVVIYQLIGCGQLYWLLLPIQIAITIWGKKWFLLGLGYMVLFVAIFNYQMMFVLYVPIVLFGAILEEILGFIGRVIF